MKRLFSYRRRALVAALFVTSVAFQPLTHAQQFSVVPLLTGGTQNIPGSGTSNYTAVVNVRGANSVGILTGTKLISADTNDVVFKFSKSVDGSVFETTPSVLITNSSTSVALNKVTIVDTTGVHTLKLATVVNGSSVALTNLTVTAGVKNIFR